MRHTRADALPVLIGIALTLGACTGLKTKRFADDPTFPETASSIQLTVHAPANVHATRRYSFTSERPETGAPAERLIDITWDVPSRRLAALYESEEHTLVLVDHSSNRAYEVSGVTTVIREEEIISEGVSEETAQVVTPVTFWIHENEQQAGHVTVTWPDLGPEIHFEIVLNGTQLRIEYGASLSGARYFACERKNRLAAFTELSYRGTTGGGEVLVRLELVEGLEPVILASLVMADVLIQVLDQLT